MRLFMTSSRLHISDTLNTHLTSGNLKISFIIYSWLYDKSGFQGRSTPPTIVTVGSLCAQQCALRVHCSCFQELTAAMTHMGNSDPPPPKKNAQVAEHHVQELVLMAVCSWVWNLVLLKWLIQHNTLKAKATQSLPKPFLLVVCKYFFFLPNFSPTGEDVTVPLWPLSSPQILGDLLHLSS